MKNPFPTTKASRAWPPPIAILCTCMVLATSACSRKADVPAAIADPVDTVVTPFEQTLLRAVTYPETAGSDGPFLIEDRLTFYATPGASVVAWNGADRIERAFGTSDPEQQTAMSVATVLPAGSRLSTGVAAFAVTALLTESSRNLNAEIGVAAEAFGLSSQLRERTLGQLLSHTGGVGPSKLPADATDLDRFLSQRASAEFTQGTQFQFSETGYAIVQRYFEQAYVRPFDDLAQSRLFDPLSLDDIRFGSSQRDSRLYDRRGRAASDTGSTAVAADGLRASAKDLAMLLQAVQATLRRDLENPPISPKQLGFVVTSRLGGWGMGWQLVGPSRRPIAIVAFDESEPHYAIAFLDRPAGAVVTTNAAADGRLALEIALGVAQSFGWEYPVPGAGSNPTPGFDVLPTLVGGYELNGRRFDVEWASSQLLLLPGEAFPELGTEPAVLLGRRTGQWTLRDSPMIITLRRQQPAALLIDSNLAIKVGASPEPIELNSE